MEPTSSPSGRSAPRTINWRYVVSDTGVGLPSQQADQIFNTFFTTKPSGTGMGLSICRSIVESHGGRLWATDNIPRGANFHIVIARGEPQGLSRAMAR